MPLTTNLVSYYKLDGNSTDAAGSNNGTDTSITYSLANGKINQGAGFDGSTSKIVAKTAKIIGDQANSSISLWVNNTLAQSSSINGYTLYSERGSSGNDIWKLEIHSGKTVSANAGKVDFAHRDDANTLDNFAALTSVKVNDGSWHHIVLTKSGTSIIIYVDGISQGTATLTGSDTLTDASLQSWIGQDQGDSTAKYTGAIDEVGIWNRTLTASEVSQLYNTGFGLAYPLVLPITSTYFVAPTMDFYSTTLKGQISGSSSNIALASIGNLQPPGVVVIDRTNTATPPTSTPSVREVVSFGSIVSINILTSLTRGLDGSPTTAHADGALVETNWTAGMWNSLTTILKLAVDTQGLLNAISSPVSIAIAQVGTNINVSAASVTGFGFMPLFAASGPYSGPTIGIAGLYIAPRAGTLNWVSVVTRYVASGTSVGFDLQVRGVSVFANATTRPAIVAGGTFVSTASIATKNINAGDILQANVDSMLSGGGLIQEISVQGGIG